MIILGELGIFYQSMVPFLGSYENKNRNSMLFHVVDE